MYKVVESLSPHTVLHPVFPPVNGVPWPQEPGRRNSHTFNCRMLKRPPDEVDSENPEARQQYEIMQCFTVSQPRSVQEEGEGACHTHLFRLPSFQSKLPYHFQKRIWHSLVNLILKRFLETFWVCIISRTYLEMILVNLVRHKLN